MSENRYLTAAQAAAALGVTRATLYAYISRGLLTSTPAPGQPRQRRYYREDIQRLRDRKEIRRDPARAVAKGLHWGTPVLSSSITLIHNGRLYYRGRDAIKLAETATLEQIAELLWQAEPSEELFAQPAARRRKLALAGNANPLVPFQIALPMAGASDAAAYDLRPAAVRRTGARIVRLLASLAARQDFTGPIHSALQRAWSPRDASAAEAIRTALVLCADHELNVSAFTARCAASAHASLYDVISAGLAALKGSRHGGETARIATLFDECATPKHARAVIANRLRLGERLSGFGHPLYPDGDPRAAMLLDLAARGPAHHHWKVARALTRVALALTHDRPNMDFGLVAVARAFRLPAEAPLTLFALGRAAGWIAHAMEQYASAELIRPRANYTGPAPSELIPPPADSPARQIRRPAPTGARAQ